MKYFYDRYWGIFTADAPNQDPHPIVGYGYSGAASAGALNDIHRQNLQNIGPLPAGTYTITSIIDDPKRGSHTCILTPAPTNQMYGRSGFLIHGDTAALAHDASDGCIVSPLLVRIQFQVGDVVDVL